MKLPLLFLAILFCQQNDYAQVIKTDSLLALLKNAKQDTNRVNVLNELAYAYRNIQPDTGLLYAQQALSLAEQLQWKPGIGKAYKCMGNNYHSLSDPDRSLEYYKKALKIYEQIGDKTGIAGALGNIGSVYQFFLSDYLKALEYQEKALMMFEQLKDKRGIAMNLSNLAILYEILGDYPKALETFQKTLNLYEETGNKDGMATLLGNMGIFYNDLKDNSKALEYCKRSLTIFEQLGNKVGIAKNHVSIGNIYLDLLNFQNALDHYQKSIDLFEQIGESSGTAKSLGNIGMVYAESADFFKALQYYQKSYDLNKQLGNKSGMANVLWNIGDVYIRAPDAALQKMGVLLNKRYPMALENLTHSLNISTEIGEMDLQEIALEKLSIVYEKQRNFAKAYETYKTFIGIRDSILNDEKRKEITHKEIAYIYDRKEVLLKAEHEKKDALALAEIKRQRLIRNGILAGVAVVGIFSFLLMRSFIRRRKMAFDKRVAEVEMIALRSQMNPHFVFNSLQSIHKYVLDNDKLNASAYLSRFSRLMRLILENSREHEVLLEQDLEALELYMQLEALRFENRFRYNIEVDEKIDTANTMIPPLMLQPFVENAIIHGLQNKEKGLIQVRVNREGDMIRCIVEDNGMGREQSVSIDKGAGKKRESLGLKITQERLHIINQVKKVKAAIHIFDLKNAEHQTGGLRIELLLPFEQAF